MKIAILLRIHAQVFMNPVGLGGCWIEGRWREAIMKVTLFHTLGFVDKGSWLTLIWLVYKCCAHAYTIDWLSLAFLLSAAENGADVS